MFSLIKMSGRDDWICLTDFKTRGEGRVLSLRGAQQYADSLLCYEKYTSEDLDHIIIPGEFT